MWLKWFSLYLLRSRFDLTLSNFRFLNNNLHSLYSATKAEKWEEKGLDFSPKNLLLCFLRALVYLFLLLKLEVHSMKKSSMTPIWSYLRVLICSIVAWIQDGWLALFFVDRLSKLYTVIWVSIHFRIPTRQTFVIQLISAAKHATSYLHITPSFWAQIIDTMRRFIA